MIYYENETNILKQRIEDLPNCGKIYVLTILCPTCQGKKKIDIIHEYECQDCLTDGTIDVVRYSTYMNQVIKNNK